MAMTRREEQRRLLTLERQQARSEAEAADRAVNPDLYRAESLPQVAAWDLFTGDHRRDKGK